MAKQPKREPTLQSRKDQLKMIKYARKDGLLITPRFIPEKLEEQNELGNELLNWAHNTDSITIDDFFLMKRIAPSQFYKSLQFNPYLNICYETALASINKRLVELLKNNHNYLLSTVKHYDSQFIEEARLKREAEQNSKVITTFIEERIGIPVFTKEDKDAIENE